MLTINSSVNLSFLFSEIESTDPFFNHQLSLETLHLSRNKLGDAGMEQIAKGIQTSRSPILAELSLAQCDIGLLMSVVIN